MRIGLLWCALVLSVTVLQAQHLKRSGTLGIYPAALSATEALKAGMDAPKGIKVAKVMPGSAAEAIGIAEGDLVLEVNGEAVESPAGIVAQLGELSAGEEVVLTTIRDGRKLTQTGPMGARPLPLAPGATIDFGEVPYGGGHLRSFLEKPQGDGPFPVIYFLQGYTCQTVEHASPHSPMRKLFNQWVSNGYAVFRVEKPGVGDSAGTPNCESIDFDAELLAFKAGYKALLKQDGIDTEQLFLYGHSLGGVVAPFLAAEFQPAGVMAYGFVLKPWKDYMFDIHWDQRIRMGEDPGQAMADLQSGRHLLNAYFDDELAPAEFLKTDEDRAAFAGLMSYDGQDHCFGRHYSFWQTMDRKNLPAEWQRVDCPVLAMYGEYDLAAIDDRGAKQLAGLINRERPGNGTFQLIEKTNHSLLKMDNFEEQLDFATGQSEVRAAYYQNNFNDQFADCLLNWMSRVSGKTR